MRERFLGSVLLVALVTALSASADEKGKSPGSKDRIDADKLPPGFFAGQLKSVPSAKDRDFVLQLEYGRVEVKDPNGLARAKGQLAGLVNQINRVQAEMARSRNPEAQLGRLQELTARLQRDSANLQQNYFRTVPERKEVTFHAADDLVVRLR